MTLKELVNCVNFEDLWPIYRDTYLICNQVGTPYTDEEKSKIKLAYSACFNHIKQMPVTAPAANEPELILTVIEYYNDLYDEEEDDFPDSEMMFSVSGYCPSNDTTYGIDLNDWSELLHYPILERSLREYGAAACMAHILWEITFHGITPEDVAQRRDEIEQAIAEVETEDPKNYKTWEEVRDELGFEETRTEEEQEENMRKMREKIDMNQKIMDDFLSEVRCQNNDGKRTN